MGKIRTWPRDEKGHDIKPECIDPLAIERDYDHKIVRMCRFRHASGKTCYRRWAGTNGPKDPCPIREMHFEDDDEYEFTKWVEQRKKLWRYRHKRDGQTRLEEVV